MKCTLAPWVAHLTFFCLPVFSAHNNVVHGAMGVSDMIICRSGNVLRILKA